MFLEDISFTYSEILMSMSVAEYIDLCYPHHNQNTE